MPPLRRTTISSPESIELTATAHSLSASCGGSSHNGGRRATGAGDALQRVRLRCGSVVAAPCAARASAVCSILSCAAGLRLARTRLRKRLDAGRGRAAHSGASRCVVQLCVQACLRSCRPAGARVARLPPAAAIVSALALFNSLRPLYRCRQVETAAGARGLAIAARARVCAPYAPVPHARGGHRGPAPCGVAFSIP